MMQDGFLVACTLPSLGKEASGDYLETHVQEMRACNKVEPSRRSLWPDCFLV